MISKSGLRTLISKHQDCAEAAYDWYEMAKAAEWQTFAAVRASVRSVDQVGRVLVFNLRGNAYRLIVGVDYRRQRLFIKDLLSHAECDRKEWMRKWA